jgi:hypothetical protein
MGDLRPLGSEKLEGMDKINRIIQLSNYKQPNNNNVERNAIDENSTSEYTIKLTDGFYYGIVKETKGYILKTSVDSKDWSYMKGITERKYYNSYSQALKRLNIIVSENSRNNGYDYEIPLIGEQAGVKKKFVLKRPKVGGDATTATPEGGDTAAPAPADMGAPAPPPPADMAAPPADMAAPPADMGAPAPPPPADMGATPPSDMGMGAPTDMGETPPTDMGMDAPTGEPPMEGEEGMEMENPEMGDTEEAVGPTGLKTIQKLTGRLSQKIRSFDKDKGLDSQDIKYVLNSIISAIDVAKLDEDDKEDILDKFDQMDEYGAEEGGEMDLSGEEDMGMSDMGMGMETPPQPEPPVTESKVSKVLSKYFEITEDEKPLLEEKRKKDYIQKKLTESKVKKEIEILSESTQQMVVAKKIFSENSNIKFVGKTNKENLLFVSNGKKIRVTPRGRII